MRDRKIGVVAVVRTLEDWQHDDIAAANQVIVGGDPVFFVIVLCRQIPAPGPHDDRARRSLQVFRHIHECPAPLTVRQVERHALPDPVFRLSLPQDHRVKRQRVVRVEAFVDCILRIRRGRLIPVVTAELRVFTCVETREFGRVVKCPDESEPMSCIPIPWRFGDDPAGMER